MLDRRRSLGDLQDARDALPELLSLGIDQDLMLAAELASGQGTTAVV